MRRIALGLAMSLAAVLWSPPVGVVGDPAGVRHRPPATRAAVAEPVALASRPDPRPPSLTSGYVTRDGSDAYELAPDRGSTRVRALPSNQEGTTRILFWRPEDAVTRDHETCATWDPTQSDGRQQGAALRVTRDGDRVRGVTVTKNVAFYQYWVFNVHLMDSTSDRPFQGIGRFVLMDGFLPAGQLRPGPWRMCARASGSLLAIKVWPLSEPEPVWGDPTYGGIMQLPPGWDRPGRPGWYAGHLMPGEEALFTDMTTSVATVAPSRSG